MKHRISLSVMPLYYCEYNCKFCYLGDLRKNKERLKIGLLNSQIKDIVTKYDVEQCLVYGGEISLLPAGYLYSIFSLLFRYLNTVSAVSMLSNLSVIAQLLDKFPALQISTSYNFDEYSKLIENRIQKLKQFYKKPIVVNTLISKALISKDIKEIERILLEIGATAVLFLPYSKSVLNKANASQYEISFSEYEQFLISTLHSFKHVKVLNTPNQQSKRSLFITPQNEYALVQYNDKLEEHFEICHSLLNFEYKYVQSIPAQCISCKYYENKCMADHMLMQDNQCNGLKTLIQDYEAALSSK